MIGELQVAAVQARLVAVRVGDRGFEIVADHELERAAQEGEQVHMGADPVGNLLQCAAATLGVTPQTIFKYLKRGLLIGRQLTKGQPWQIDLADHQILHLRDRLQRIRRSRMKAA
jgi:hypothetical protein